MAQSIDRRGMDSVIQGFDTFNSPFYAVLQSGAIKYIHDEDDMESAKDLLRDNMEAAKQAGSDALYQIRFYRGVPDGGIDSKTGYIGSFNFKVQDEPKQYIPYQVGASPELTQMQQKIAALEEKAQVEYEPDERPGIIETLIQNPQVLMGAIAGITQIVKDLFKPHSQSQPKTEPPELYQIPDGAITEEEIDLLNYYRGLDEKTKAFLKSQMK